MDYFVKPVDSISRLINENAEKLYQKLEALPVEQLKISNVVSSYFKNHHKKRSFFSVQTAAELLYRSIKQKGKAIDQLSIMDYGAGVGSLYILAKMIGCKMVVYNDILDDMTAAGKAIADYLNIPIDLYITSGHVGTIAKLQENNISCDIILSRNVVEHIYDLDDFYGKMAVGQPDALIYFSTTANYHNPAMLIYHQKVHAKYERTFVLKRAEIIQSKIKDIASNKLDLLAKATQGLALNDLNNAIQDFKQKNILPDPKIHKSNTCNPEDGVWAEHILSKSDYKRIIESKGYNLTIKPAFWDTHYSSTIKNIFGKTMNMIGNILGDKAGLRTTAFIYVIAEKK